MNNIPSPELPAGISIDDLRFVHPMAYPMDMAMKGWAVAVDQGIEGNGALSSYTLARPAGEDFDLQQLEDLQRQIGIVDQDGRTAEGYSLVVESFDDSRPLVQQLNQLVNPHINHGRILVFGFKGFPTQKTMDVLLRIEEAFMPPKRPSLVSRILGKTGLSRTRH